LYNRHRKDVERWRQQVERAKASSMEEMKEIAQQKKKQQLLIQKYLFNPKNATKTAVQIIEKELGISNYNEK
jgi:hypothetical protein